MLGAKRTSARRAKVYRLEPSEQSRTVQLANPIGHELFRDALARERKRADRFEATFVLVLMSLDNATATPSHWAELVRAVATMTFDGDLVGWFQHGSVLGLMRAIDDGGSPEFAATSAAAIQQELLKRLTPEHARLVSIQLETYSPQGHAVPAPLVAGPQEGSEPRKLVRDVTKRALDVAGSSTLLLALAPVLLVVAALVKLSSKGPVLFRQQRVGVRGQPFPMLKFRTMHVNADPGIHRQYVENFIQSRETSEGGSAVVFKIVNDPRVTRIGHFLRRTSLDELPQFWNVLRGEMSLVGPRPPLPYEVARYKRWHYRRVLDAKPGITGLWQVTGRSRTTFDEMVRLDLRYAATHSVWFDLKILLATPRAVLTGKGAH